MLNCSFTTTETKFRPMLRDRCPVMSVYNIGVLWPNSWMDQDATWYGGRPWPRR